MVIPRKGLIPAGGRQPGAAPAATEPARQQPPEPAVAQMGMFDSHDEAAVAERAKRGLEGHPETVETPQPASETADGQHAPESAGNGQGRAASKLAERKAAKQAAGPTTRAGTLRKDTAVDVQFDPDLDIGLEVSTAVREPTAFTDIKPNELAAIIPSKPGIALDHNAVKAYLFMHDYALEQGLRTGDARKFRVNLVRLEREAGIGAKDRRNLKKSMRDLVSATVEWNTPRVNAAGETTVWEVSSMLAYVKFLYDKNHTLVLEWAYSDPLLDKLRLVGNYFRMRLKSLRETRTYGGWALYLYLSRYRTFPGARTDTKHWRDWVPILTGKHLDDFDKSDKENVGNSWRYFHRDVVRKAVAEVNAIQNDYLAVERFVKVGHRVTDLWFELQPIAVQVEDASPAVASIIDRMAALDYKERDAQRIIASSRREDIVNALTYVETRLKASTGHKILNKRAYFRTILTKFTAGEMTTDGELEKKAAAGLVKKGVESVEQMDVELRKLLQAWAENDISMTLAKGSKDEAAVELVRLFETEGLATMHERTQKAWASKGLTNETVRGDVVKWLVPRIHPIPESHEELVAMGFRHGVISLAALQPKA
jgi:hypothetical protein